MIPNMHCRSCLINMQFHAVLLVFLSSASCWKWYEGNLQKNYGIDEHIWSALWSHDMCSNKPLLDLKSKIEHLGMDVFMPLMGKYYDKSQVTSDDLTILTIHHMTTMLSYTYRETLAPREVFTGTLYPIEYEDGKGKKHKEILDPVARQLNRICPHNESDLVTNFVTGFSVNSTNPKSYMVCSDEFLTIDYTANVTDDWKFQSQSLKDSCSNESNLPIFCDRSEGKLMSIAALPKSLNDEEPYLIGYYSEDRGLSSEKAAREYTIIVYESINSQTDLATKYSGYLSEVDIFRADSEGVYIMYFTVEGFACYFRLTYAELFPNGALDEAPNLERINVERDKTNKFCRSYQTYIGCPMGYCTDNAFDASFTVEEDNKTIIYFTNGLYYWKLHDYGLPLEVPDIANAYKPVRYIKPGSSWWNALVDSIVKFFRRMFGLLFYAKYPCDDYIVNPESSVCMTRNVGAAFALPLEDSFLVYYYETVKNKWFISPINDLNKKNEMQEDPFSKQAGTLYNAAWYNSIEKAVYLFTDANFKVYEHDETGRKWTYKAQGTLSQFGIKAPYLDAVVNREDGGHFFYLNFHWKVPELGWERTDIVDGVLSFRNFFDVRRECYYNGMQAFEELLLRYGGDNFTELYDEPKVITREKVDVRSEKSSSTWIIWLIVGLGILVVFISWIAMFLLGPRKDKTKIETIVAKEEVKNLKGSKKRKFKLSQKGKGRSLGSSNSSSKTSASSRT